MYFDGNKKWREILNLLKKIDLSFKEKKSLKEGIIIVKEDNLQIFLNINDIELIQKKYLNSLKIAILKTLNKNLPFNFYEINDNFDFLNKHNIFLETTKKIKFYSFEQSAIYFQIIKDFIKSKNSTNNIYYLWGNKGIGKTHLIGTLLTEYLNKTNFVYIDTLNFVNKIYEYKRLEKPFEYIINWISKYELIIFDSFQTAKNKIFINDFFIDLIEHLKNKKMIFICSCKDFVFEGISKKLISKFSYILKINDPSLKDIYTIIINFVSRQNKNIKLSKEAINLLVEMLGNNIHLIINKLINILMFIGNPDTFTVIDIDYLKKTIKKIDSFKKNKELINYSNNQQVKFICKKLNFDIKEIFLKTRKKDIVLRRNIVIYILKKKLNFSYEDIGKIFNKDHSTIIHSVKTIEEKIKDKFFKQYLENFF